MTQRRHRDDRRASAQGSMRRLWPCHCNDLDVTYLRALGRWGGDLCKGNSTSNIQDNNVMSRHSPGSDVKEIQTSDRASMAKRARCDLYRQSLLDTANKIGMECSISGIGQLCTAVDFISIGKSFRGIWAFSWFAHLLLLFYHNLKLYIIKEQFYLVTIHYNYCHAVVCFHTSSSKTRCIQYMKASVPLILQHYSFCTKE